MISIGWNVLRPVELTFIWARKRITIIILWNYVFRRSSFNTCTSWPSKNRHMLISFQSQSSLFRIMFPTIRLNSNVNLCWCYWVSQRSRDVYLIFVPLSLLGMRCALFFSVNKVKQESIWIWTFGETVTLISILIIVFKIIHLRNYN